MDYKLVQKVNPQKRNEPAKWYAVPLTGEAESSEEVAKAATANTTTAAIEMQAAMEHYGEYILAKLQKGEAVSLGKLGTLRPTFKSEGAADIDAFNPNTMISTPRIRFIASKWFRNAFKNGITYRNAGVKDGDIDYATISAYKQAKAQESGSGTE